MMPVGFLMKEHRVIERMIALIGRELEALEGGVRADTAFIAAAVDFLRTYADRCHHGKEEDILFKNLSTKVLAGELKTVLDELVAEHALARAATGRLAEANTRYARGDHGGLTEMKAALRWLAEFYPRHIEKEDKHFFLPVMSCFGAAEQRLMIAEFDAFDKNLIHEKYRAVVTGLEAQRSTW